MFKWMDKVYVNARKKIFKNLDTGEILNLELQDDPDNIVKESDTPLSAHCLNMAQQELVDDMSKTYTGTNITAPTVAGVGRIDKIYGNTTEIGTGEKSPDNPYTLKCVGDDVNLYNEATKIVGELIQTNGTTTVNADFTHSDYIRVNSNELISVVFTKKSNAQIVLIEYDINKTFIKGNFYDFRNTTADDKYTITTSSSTSYVIAEYRNDLSMGDMKVCKGIPTPWSLYGKGTIENISKNGSNTSSNIVYVDKPLCSIGNARDEIDYSNKKIIRRCGYLKLYEIESNYFTSIGDYFIAQFTASNYEIKGPILCNCLKFISSGNWEAEDESISYGGSTGNLVQVKVLKSRLETLDNSGILKFLKSVNAEIVYKLATPVTENINCSDKVVQYADTTNVYNTDGAEIEVSLTNNEAISEINENLNKIEKITNNYSLEEQIIGKWINRKPLYRKVVVKEFEVSSQSSGLINLPHGIVNVKEVTGVCAFSENGQRLPYIDSTGGITILDVVSQAHIQIRYQNSSWNKVKWYFVLEYTKTTD